MSTVKAESKQLKTEKAVEKLEVCHSENWQTELELQYVQTKPNPNSSGRSSRKVREEVREKFGRKLENLLDKPPS
jgi:hypothetical protein